MKQMFFCLSSAVVCLFVAGCRTKLADQPLTSQQREWAEAMERLNPKWRLPYHAPVRGKQQAGSSFTPGYAFPPALDVSPLPPMMGYDDLSLPALPPVSHAVELPASPGFDDVVLVPMTGDSGAAVGARVHTVGKGDTLSSISRLYYGNANQWRRIYEANRDRIDSPDRLKVGADLRIPSAN